VKITGLFAFIATREKYRDENRKGRPGFETKFTRGCAAWFITLYIFYIFETIFKIILTHNLST